MSTPSITVATIPGGGSISPGVDLPAPGLYAIEIDDPWTAAPLSVLVSQDGGASWLDLDSDGNAVVLPAATGRRFQLDPDQWFGVDAVKVRSGTSDAPVPQTADTRVLLIGFSAQPPPPPPPPVLVPVPALTLVGDGTNTYVGANFPATQPDTQRVYTMDFLNNLDILDRTTASFGGSPTLGDLVGITFSNISFADGDVSILRTVQAADTMASIAGTIAAGINGNPVLTGAGLSASANGAVITISQPAPSSTTMASVLVPLALLQNSGSQLGLPQATETILFASGDSLGEIILSVTCDVVSFEGFIDAAPANRILSDATITGSKVSFLLGNFLAGVVYRVTFTATTFQQPDIVLYSHILCGLPQ